MDLPLTHLPFVVDLVLAFTVLEMVALLAWRQVTGRGLAVRQWLPMMAAGGCLMVALRLAVGGAEMHWILLSLLGSAVAHATDLARRWPTGQAVASGAARDGSTALAERLPTRP